MRQLKQHDSHVKQYKIQQWIVIQLAYMEWANAGLIQLPCV